MNIINYTRYNTGDLQDIVNRIESHPAFIGWRIAADKSLTVTEFDPANPYVNTRSMRWNKSEAPVKRYVAKGTWGVPQNIALLIPAKIYENALESLTQAASEDGEQLVPKAMLTAFIEALQGRLKYPAYNGLVSQEVNIISSGLDTGLRIRINKKPELKKPKTSPSAAADARKLYAQQNVRMVRWTAEKSRSELIRLARKHFPVADTHLKGRVQLLDPVRVAVLEAETALQKAIEAMSAFESAV